MHAATQTDLFRKPVGRQVAEHGASAAAAHADRSTRGEWTIKAWEFFVEFGRAMSGKTFMAEDVRQKAEKSGKVPKAPDARAWGAIVMRAKQARLIKRVDYAPNKDPSCHGSPKAVWAWIG